jgi:hypothetical protein
MVATDTACPSASELAAFFEGNLEGEERDWVSRHLNECRDCLALYADTVQVLRQLDDVSDVPMTFIHYDRAVAGGRARVAGRYRVGTTEDDGLACKPIKEASGVVDDAGDGSTCPPAEEPRQEPAAPPTGNVVPFRRSRGLKSWALPLAAVIVATVVASRLIVSLDSFPLGEARKAAEGRSAAQRETAAGELLSGMRGGGSKEESSQAAFQLGAWLVDQDLFGDLTNYHEALAGRARNLVVTLGGGDATSPELQTLDLDPNCQDWLRRYALASLKERIRSFVQGGCRAELEKSSKEYLELPLGRWTEASKAALLLGQSQFFTERRVRDFPGLMLRRKEAPWSPEVQKDLRDADTILRRPMSSQSREELQTLLDDIGRNYSTTSDSSDTTFGPE